MSEPRVLFISTSTGNPFYSDGTYGTSRKSKWWVKDAQVIVCPHLSTGPIPLPSRAAGLTVQADYQQYLATLIVE